MTLKEWEDIYNSSTRKMEPDWTTMMDKKVRSYNFCCTLVFKNYHVNYEEARKINSSLFRCIVTCKVFPCQWTFKTFIRDEPTYRDSIVVHIWTVEDEDHSANEKAVARHLTEKARLEVGKKANTIGCLKIFQEKVEKANEEMLSAGDFTGSETAEIIKYAAADYQKNFQFDENIFRQCRIRQ